VTRLRPPPKVILTMDKLFSRNNLLFMLIALMLLKYAVVPLLDWQSSTIADVNAKQQQLGKTIDLINHQDDYYRRVIELSAEKNKLSRLFYRNNGSTKLEIQKDIEGIFSANSLVIERLNWVIDDSSDNGLRRLRVLVAFNGKWEAVIRSLLDIGNHSKIVRQVEWRQNLTNNSKADLGQSRGHVTLEFYASNELKSPMEQDQNLAAFVEASANGG